jgi:hypothetical protein
MCGSFLKIQSDYVYLIHQSVKDYLSGKARAIIFPSGLTDAHHIIFWRSLDAMSMTLRRNIYDLHPLGLLTSEVITPEPDPLAAVRYSCVRWINHFCDMHSESLSQHQGLRDDESVRRFFDEFFLYWLEAMSLLRAMAEAVLSVTRLENLLKVSLLLLSPSRTKLII